MFLADFLEGGVAKTFFPNSKLALILFFHDFASSFAYQWNDGSNEGAGHISTLNLKCTMCFISWINKRNIGGFEVTGWLSGRKVKELNLENNTTGLL